MITGIYQSSNGKDYMLMIKDNSKKLIQKDLETGFKQEYPFHNKSDAIANLRSWMHENAIRIPKQFCIATEDEKKSKAIIRLLSQLNLPHPSIVDLKKYLVFHHHDYMILDDFDNINIPEVDIKYLQILSNNLRKSDSNAKA